VLFLAGALDLDGGVLIRRQQTLLLQLGHGLTQQVGNMVFQAASFLVTRWVRDE
jgi:hypothetical protein